MSIDVFGGNCVGKTTLVRGLGESEPITFVELRETDYASGARALYHQSRVLMSNPVAARTFFDILALGEWKLARRFRKYLTFQTTLLSRSGNAAGVVTDEGLIKKMYEAVPFLEQSEYGAERRRWLRFNAAVGARLFETLHGAVDLFVYVAVDPVEYARRVRERGYMTDRLPEDRIFRRYELQTEIYADLLDRARAANVSVLTLRSGDRDALSALVGEVRARRKTGAA